MRRLLLIACLLVGAAVALGQPGNPNQPWGSTLGDKQRAIEFDKDGDHIAVNLKAIQTTPTPSAPDRCKIICDDTNILASIDGGGFDPIGGVGGCTCPGVGVQSTCVGSACDASGNGSVAVGVGAASGAGSVSIGHANEAAGADEVCIGQATECAGTGAIGIGQGGVITGPCVALGTDAICSGAGHVMLGNVDGSDPMQVFIPATQFLAVPVDVRIQPATAQGTNVVGGDLTLAGGRPTGTGTFGSIFFQTGDVVASGTGLGTLVNRWRISPSGNFEPITNGVYDIGSTTLEVNNIYLESIRDATSDQGWALQTNGNFEPEADALEDIGSTVQRVRQLHVTDILNSGGFRWTHEFGSPVGWRVDGTQCTLQTHAVGAQAEPRVMRCADNAAGMFQFMWSSPDSWNGSALSIKFAGADIGATPSGVMAYDVACVCASDGDVVGSFGTAANIDFTVATQFVQEQVSAAVTCAGSCASGDTVYFRALVDATATTTASPLNFGVSRAAIEYVRASSLFD